MKKEFQIEKIFEINAENDTLTIKNEFKEKLKENGFTDDQIKLMEMMYSAIFQSLVSYIDLKTLLGGMYGI